MACGQLSADSASCEMDGGPEVPCSFVVTGCDGTELLEFSEEVFDQVSCIVDIPVVGSGDFAVCFRRDHDALVLVGEQGDDPLIGIECFVGDQQIGLHGGQKMIGTDQIVGLAAAQDERCRIAEGIDQSTNFGA
jgi:hypothetical protein